METINSKPCLKVYLLILIYFIVDYFLELESMYISFLKVWYVWPYFIIYAGYLFYITKKGISRCNILELCLDGIFNLLLLGEIILYLSLSDNPEACMLLLFIIPEAPMIILAVSYLKHDIIRLRKTVGKQ